MLTHVPPLPGPIGAGDDVAEGDGPGAGGGDGFGAGDGTLVLWRVTISLRVSRKALSM